MQQIGRNIELIRYRQFGTDLVAFELVNAPKAVSSIPESTKTGKAATYKTVTDYLEQASAPLRELYSDLEAHVSSLGDDVQVKVTKSYVAFRRRNFACVEVHPQSEEMLVFVKVDPSSIELEPGFTRDVREVGHFGTGDLEIRIRDHEALDRAKALIERSYETS